MEIKIDKKELEKQLFEEKENEEGSLVIKICVPDIKKEQFKRNGLSRLETICIVKGNDVNPMTEAVGMVALDSIIQQLSKDPFSRMAYKFLKGFGKIVTDEFDIKGDEDNE